MHGAKPCERQHARGAGCEWGRQVNRGAERATAEGQISGRRNLGRRLDQRSDEAAQALRAATHRRAMSVCVIEWSPSGGLVGCERCARSAGCEVWHASRMWSTLVMSQLLRDIRYFTCLDVDHLALSLGSTTAHAGKRRTRVDAKSHDARATAADQAPAHEQQREHEARHQQTGREHQAGTHEQQAQNDGNETLDEDQQAGPLSRQQVEAIIGRVTMHAHRTWELTG